MAQSSKGIRVFWNVGKITETGGVKTFTAHTSGSTAQAWEEIRDITSIPALTGDPSTLDTTTLAQTVQKTYILGLKDNGGTMQYNGLLTANLIADAQAAVTAYNTDSSFSTDEFMYWNIQFPAPLNCSYLYIGEPLPVLPGEAEVDAVLTATFNTSIESIPEKLAAQVSNI